uniref:Glycosyltransferase family 1 protein n=1 Tax=candidate division WOR-3 bacterium TaxID=2052148 RepID=A0A7C4UCI8_UNCW3
MDKIVKKRILLLTTDFPPEIGGIQKILYTLSYGLNCKGYEIEVIAPYIKNCSEFDKKQNFKILRVPFFKLKKRFTILFWCLLLPYIILQRYNLVISGHILTTPIGLIVKYLKNIPLITYTYALEIMDLRYKKIFGFLLRKSDRVIVLSDFTKSYIREIGVKNNTIKIYPGIDLNLFDKSKYKKDEIKRELGLNGKIILTTICRLARKERYKGVDTIISILPELRNKYQSIFYLVIGGGDDLENLKELAKNYNVSDIVLFTGNIDFDEIPKYLAISDIFIMVSKEIRTKNQIKAEGLGVVFAEAQAMEIPTIGGRSGGIPDIVVENETGLLADPFKPDDVRKKIEHLLDNPNLSNKLVMNAKKRVFQEFANEIFIKRFENVIETLIKEEI